MHRVPCHIHLDSLVSGDEAVLPRTVKYWTSLSLLCESLCGVTFSLQTDSEPENVELACVSYMMDVLSGSLVCQG